MLFRSGIMGAFGSALIARERYEADMETSMLPLDPLLFNKNKTAPQPWQAIAQRFCSIGIWRDDNQSYSTENIILSHKRGVYKYGY